LSRFASVVSGHGVDETQYCSVISGVLRSLMM
jgi:hypothetical protein